MNNIIEWFKTIGIWGVIAVLAYIARMAQPLIQKLISTVKDRKLQHGLEITDKLAYNAVTVLAQFTNLSNTDRKAKAVSMVTQQLTKRGITISAQTVANTIESNYQYLKNNHLITDKQPKQTNTNDSQAQQNAQQVNNVLNPNPVNNQQKNDSDNNQDDEAKKIAQQFKNSPKAQQLIKGMSNNGQQSN